MGSNTFASDEDKAKESAKAAFQAVSKSKIATSFQAEVYLEQAIASYEFGKFKKSRKLSKKAVLNNAEKSIDKAQGLGGNTFQAEVYLDQSAASFDAGKYKKSIKLAKKSVESANASPAKSALAAIKKYKPASTFQSEVYLEQAEASLKFGKYKKALKLAKKAILDPADDAISKTSSKNTFQAEVYMEQAEAAFSGGNFKKAIKLVKKSVKRANA